ncbi:rplM [Scenedesmus sp. PABB004]|nr:rplM [Scenedesmus sp. PABB004]
MPPNPARPFAGLERVDFTGLRMRLIDADNQVIGRLAAYLSMLLQGKDKPTYAPHKDAGDVCVVVNAERAVFTGNKWEAKVYRWHTGYPGGLKEITARELWRRDPAEILRRTVAGMLPKNNLRDARLRKLRVFPGPQHPFTGVELVPAQPPRRRLRDRGLGWALPPGFEPMNPEAYLVRMRGSRLAGGGHGGAGELQQQQARAQPDGDAAGGAQPGGEPIAFDDLLTADELAFVQRSQQARAGRGGGDS